MPNNKSARIVFVLASTAHGCFEPLVASEILKMLLSLNSHESAILIIFGNYGNKNNDVIVEGGVS